VPLARTPQLSPRHRCARAALGFLLALLTALAAIGPATAGARSSHHRRASSRPRHTATRTPRHAPRPALRRASLKTRPAGTQRTGAATSQPISPPSPGTGNGGTAGTGAPGEPSGRLPADVGETVTDPIDPRFLTDLPFGRRSFWVQPWRAYLDTWPASRLLEAVGFDFPANPAVAEGTAHLLQDSGYKLVRMGISWNGMSFEDPTVFTASHIANITTRLNALRAHGLRPLIVLDANSGGPVPLKGVTLETLAAAPAGAQTVALSPASAALVVPGKTGFNHLSFGGAADILITAVNAQSIATLSRPLPAELPAGPHPGSTLRFAPFQSPTLASGAPNPGFQETLGGWLSYVSAVGKIASSVVGPGGYDLEIWNELSFGSEFLNAGHYYAGYTGGEIEHDPGAEAQPESEEAAKAESEAAEAHASEEAAENEEEAEGEEGTEGEESEGEASAARASATSATVKPPRPDRAKKEVTRAVIKALIAETVGLVRDPHNGFSPAVAITNGFSSEGPFASGAKAPIGLTALSKHPYTTQKFFPLAFKANRGRPVDAFGELDTANKKSKTPLFIPTYQSLFPEYWLTGTSTETLIRDIAPFTTYIYRFPHGRQVAPPGGVPLQKWVTEFDMRPRGAVLGPDETTPQTGAAAAVSPADSAHFQAKVILRSLIANVAKGISREYHGLVALSEGGFLKAQEADPSHYPGDASGGETMSAMHAMLSQFQGPGPGSALRQLTLGSIAQVGNHAQFAGDGTAAHAPLYDRDVLAVFPFQSSPTHFVVPLYVMTRDLLTLYRPGASPGDIHRFDLPSESFRVTLGNLPEAAAPPSVSAYDPLLQSATPARLLSRSGRSAVFEVAASDYPRMLSITYSGAVH
jgi:hypothetical protein